MCYSVMIAQDIKFLQNRFGEILVRRDQEAYFETERVKRPIPWPALNPRIYAGSFAPIYFLNAHGQLESDLMRYSAYPPILPAFEQKLLSTDRRIPLSKMSTYNARRDNLLSPFWQSAFMQGHGIVALDRFYEWVQVEDLLKAEVVQLQTINSYFAAKSEQRRSKFEADGKKWKPTPTELKDPSARKIVIEFFDPNGLTLWAPVIFNHDPASDSRHSAFSRGFAIVTDDPLPEVLGAGHDRTPAFLGEIDFNKWLEPKSQKVSEILMLLSQRSTMNLKHNLEQSA